MGQVLERGSTFQKQHGTLSRTLDELTTTRRNQLNKHFQRRRSLTTEDEPAMTVLTGGEDA